jgi:hypothetical protein
VEEGARLGVILLPVDDEDNPAGEQQEVLLGLVMGVRSGPAPLWETISIAL